jgi:hypothetical protein
MPKVLVCVFCSEEIEPKEKWPTPGNERTSSSEMLEGEHRPEVRVAARNWAPARGSGAHLQLVGPGPQGALGCGVPHPLKEL